MGRGRPRIACWRQFSSPTSSAPASARLSSATAPGASCSTVITRLIRRELLRFRGQEIDTAGDGFLRNLDGPARAIRCACSIVEAVKELGLDVRIGLHTGECELADGRIFGNRRAHGSACGRARRRGGSVGLTHREGPRRRLRPSGSRIADRTSSRGFAASGDCTGWIRRRSSSARRGHEGFDLGRRGVGA